MSVSIRGLSSTCDGSCGGVRVADAILSVKTSVQSVEKLSMYHTRQGSRQRISMSSTDT